MNWTATAAITLALAVTFGAFGAHGLRSVLDDYHMGVYEKAVFYHFIHALGMLAVPLLVQANLIPAKLGDWAARLLLAGIVFFSGSLYALAITSTPILGAITPIGGVCFIAAWLTLCYGAMKN